MGRPWIIVIKNANFGYSQSGFQSQPTNYWLCDGGQFLNLGLLRYLKKKCKNIYPTVQLKKSNEAMVIKIWNLVRYLVCSAFSWNFIVTLKGSKVVNLIMRMFVISVSEVLLNHIIQNFSMEHGKGVHITRHQQSCLATCSIIKEQRGHLITLCIWQKDSKNT